MITAVGLTDFMSYKNSLIPLKLGLNLIGGPNGAGKSSILLAISLVLGLTYTERGRRLSDLIRWGQEEARVALHFSNAPIGNHRPFPDIRADQVVVTRVLRKNGTYAYLLNGRPVNKENLTSTFHTMSLDPENMLIIMHQLMVTRFASVSAQEKLQMLEQAVGIAAYRENVLAADEKLRFIAREENSLSSILESTTDTYEYWRREYERYQLKKELEKRLRNLRAELAWTRVVRLENGLSRLKERLGRQVDSIKKNDSAMVDAKRRRELAEFSHRELYTSLSKLFSERLRMEKQAGVVSGTIESMKANAGSLKQDIQFVENELPSVSEVKAGVLDRLEERAEGWMALVAKLQQEKDSIQRELKANEEEYLRTKSSEDKQVLQLINDIVEHRVLEFKHQLLVDQLNELTSQQKTVEEDLDLLVREAEALGERVTSVRKTNDILKDVGMLEAQIKPLVHLSDEVEKQFALYETIYKGLADKAETYARNRREIMKEVKARFEKWKNIIDGLLEELAARYSTLLADVNGSGTLRLVGGDKIREAGIELWVGFRGSPPTPLDSFSQSGGERSVALVAFLLSLQQYVKSPFRAIDEFDVHMDPRNRETITRLIISSVRNNPEGQYLAITPGEITVPESERLNLIVVQNVGGESSVKEMIVR